MRGYKAFNRNLQCHGFQYEIGKTFEYDGEIKICEKGFHFCDELFYCFKYYPADLTKTRIAEIEAIGSVAVDFSQDKHKFCTDKIKIIRELTFEEIVKKMNIGNPNFGYGNEGENNFGSLNIGTKNYGSTNKGQFNYGAGNIGGSNIGMSNTGTDNKGYLNVGNYNIGELNKGDGNIGINNNGQFNIGVWNKGNYCVGVLCDKTVTVKMFNKDTDWTYEQLKDFQLDRKIQGIIDDIPTKVEIAKEIKNLPNFDNKIFKNITGIDIKEILKNTRKVL